jgi:GNAT superfamily N-acetyltransferase
MQISRDDRVRMERAHVLAWPALHRETIDGWLWRASGGGSQRANSVSTIDFTGNDLAAAIDTVEARYRTRGAPARFQTFDDTAPPDLTTSLQRRGYREGEATLTMFKRLERTTAVVPVETRDHAWDQWCDVYLGAITPSRRTVNREILTSIPTPRAFFGCRVDGHIVSTALCITGFGCAVIECVATRPDARRRGSAMTVMSGLLAWAAQQDADLIGLQVVATNTPAIRLYEALGFVPGATNRFWQVAGAR